MPMREVPTVTGTSFTVHAPDIEAWAEITAHLDPAQGHQYTVTRRDDPDTAIASLRYITDFPLPGIITIGFLNVEPEYRRRGVAIALLARLHADHPDHKINPGAPPSDGVDFIAHILQTEPEVRAAGALLHSSMSHLRTKPAPG